MVFGFGFGSCFFFFFFFVDRNRPIFSTKPPKTDKPTEDPTDWRSVSFRFVSFLFFYVDRNRLRNVVDETPEKPTESFSFSVHTILVLGTLVLSAFFVCWQLGPQWLYGPDGPAAVFQWVEKEGAVGP